MAGERETLAGHVDGHGIAGKVRPQHRAEPTQQRGRARLALGGEHQRAPALGAEREADLRLRHREPAQDLGDGGGLGPVGFEEFQPGRGRGEEFGDLDPGAAGRGRRAHRALGAGIDRQAHPLPLGGARGEGEPRDRADRGQGLAAKAERADPGEVAVGELRGGVALDGERQILRPHADPVVDDADQAPPATLDRHLDAAGAGIDGVLHQLLDRGGRPLDHLACGDAIDQDRVEAADGGTRWIADIGGSGHGPRNIGGPGTAS